MDNNPPAISQVEHDPDAYRLAKIARTLPGVAMFQYCRCPDGHSRFTYADSEFQRVFGIAPEHVLNDPEWLCTLVHPDDRAQVRAVIEDSALHLKPRSARYRLHHAERGWIWVEARATPEQLSNGGLLWHGLMLDINAQQTLENNLRSLVAIIDQAPDFIVLEDAQGKILFINAAGRRLFGLPESEGNIWQPSNGWNTEGLLSLGQSLDQAIGTVHPAWAADKILQDGIPTAMHQGFWLGDTAIFNAAGEEIPVSQAIMVHYDAQGHITHRSTIMRDMSQRNAMEQALRQSEAEYRLLFETMGQGVIYQSADGTIISVNPEAERILGLGFADICGASYNDPRWQMIMPDGSPVASIDHPTMIALRTGQSIGPVVRGMFNPQRQTYVWMTITAVPLFRAGETQAYQTYATFADITDLTHLQQREQRHNAILTAMLDSKPLQAILTAIVESVEQENLQRRCSILLVSEDGRYLQHGAAPHLPDFYNRQVAGTPIGNHRGSCGTAAFRKERVITEDILNDPDWDRFRAVALEAGLRACWSEPVVSSTGQVLAVFAIYHHQPMTPSSADLESIQTAASLTRLAIERVRSEQDLRHRNALEELIRSISTRFLALRSEEVDAGINWALQCLGEFMHADRCYMLLFSQDGQRMSTTHEWCAAGVIPQIDDLQNVKTEDFAWSIQRTRCLQWYTISRSEIAQLAPLERQLFEEGGVQSLLGIPIYFSETLQGVLGLDDTHKERYWSEADCRLLQVAASIIGTTLERRQLDVRLQYEANHDMLTGAFNRRWFQSVLEYEISQSERYGHNFAIILFDIDYFKQVNDRYGHDVGDRVLCALVTLVQQRIRISDVLARWGGEEFILLLPEIGLQAAQDMAELLRTRVASSQLADLEPITISLGITHYQKGDNINRIVKRADRALYAAKNRGRNRCEIEV